MEGRGKCCFANGEIYVGDWVKNSMQGNGSLIFDNISTVATYRGSFINNKRLRKIATKFDFYDCYFYTEIVLVNKY